MAAEQILLVNPRRRRRRRLKNVRRRRRSSAHRVSRRRRRLKNPFGAYMANPRRRSRRRRSHHRRRRLRNPRLGGGRLSVRGMMHQLIPAATGAVGAIGLDIAMGYVPLPAQYKTGWLGTGVKAVGAIALGMIAGKVVGREKGKLFTAGALTVIAYQALRTAVASAMPSLGLSGLGAYMTPAMPALPAPGKRMGALGSYMNPAPLLNGLNGLDGGYSNDMGSGDSYYYS